MSWAPAVLTSPIRSTTPLTAGLVSEQPGSVKLTINPYTLSLRVQVPYTTILVLIFAHKQLERSTNSLSRLALLYLTSQSLALCLFPEAEISAPIFDFIAPSFCPKGPTRRFPRELRRYIHTQDDPLPPQTWPRTELPHLSRRRKCSHVATRPERHWVLEATRWSKSVCTSTRGDTMLPRSSTRGLWPDESTWSGTKSLF